MRLALMAAVAAVMAQDQPKFEVASVKPAVQLGAGGGGGGRGDGGSGCRQALRMDRGRVNIECATIATLIGYAYRISPDRVTGPNWMVSPGSPSFDIVAKLPQGASESQIPEMVQALLADRFQLATHRGTTTREIYGLLVAKGGTKIKEAARDADAPVAVTADDPDATPGDTEFFGAVETRTTPNTDGSGWTTAISNARMGTVRGTVGRDQIQRWEAPSITLAGLADLLDKIAPVPLPIVDMTGLKSRYQVVFEVSLNDLAGTSEPAGMTNVHLDMEEVVLMRFNDGLRKLGLQLERPKGPVETVIVDRVEKTPAAN